MLNGIIRNLQCGLILYFVDVFQHLITPKYKDNETVVNNCAL